MTTPSTKPVPSNLAQDLLFNAEKLDEAINSSQLTYVDRLGATRDTLAGAVNTIKAVNTRGPWTTATAYALKDVVTVVVGPDTIAYICVAAHVSGATFAGDSASYWRVFQGVLTSDLGAAGPNQGAKLVHIIPNDQNGGSEIDLNTMLLGAIGSGITVLPSAYADSPTAEVTGLEYLWSIGSKISANRNGTYTEIKILFSGDSTTFGVNATPFTMDFCFERETDEAGLSFFKSYNRGHSGEDTVDWAQTAGYVEQDIAAHPDMSIYVPRWGLNDGLFQGILGSTTAALAQYETNLRLGLSKLRAFKDVGSLAIVLMTPNTTSEDPYRNERWHEKIQAIIRKAARDYQCVFIDTYQIFRDGRRGAIGKWLDNVSGAGIHPDAWLTMMIARKVAEVVLSPWRNLGYATFYNVPGGKVTKAPTAPPYEYQFGLSIYRTDSNVAWPVSGVVRTERHADNVIIQTLTGLGGSARSYRRKAIDINTWGDWNGRRVLSLSNGWVIKSGFPGPTAYKDDNNLVTITAALDGASKTSNQAIVLPAGWRPLTNAVGSACTQTGQHGGVVVDSSGGVTIVQGGMSNFLDAHISFQFEAFN